MKNLYVCTLLLILSFLTFSCQKEVRSTPELAQIFNTQEIEDLNLIVSFYEERIKKQTNTDQIDSAFHKFAEKNVLKNSYDFSGFDKKSVQQFYDDINPQTYDQIWYENKGYNYKTNDSITISNIAYEKKFMTYLDVIGKTNPKIKFVLDYVKSTGMVQGILVSTLYQDFDEDGTNARLSEKIGDYNNRVITAVFTITIADNILRDEIQLKKEANLNQNK